MLDIAALPEVCETLPTAMPDCPFRTQGKVVAVRYEQDHCHFTLSDGEARLLCVVSRQTVDFWVEVGQTVEVEGYAGRSEGQPRLDVVVAERVDVSPAFLHPANAEEIANVAAETGAEVLRGPLRYPSESGGWQLGDVQFRRNCQAISGEAETAVDLSEHLSKYRDCDLVVIIAATGEAEEKPVICGICGFVLDEVSDCPRCKLMVEENAKRIRARRDERAEMLQEVERILGDEYG